ncbi:MAG: Unknown protein [uncultured Campylobacterales bacterium]|uniref:Antitoxin n=1 Tax=uncultured Campylobacterales bacterium TaxID=352960 RepID=A0A6S6SU33_9BACT|nr:MAG: Unknown protein [uncultured Campylobacterales bacterium]
MIVNIAEAKANLSKLIQMVLDGEKVVLAKNNFPLIDLVPHQEKKEIQFGLAEGKIEFIENIMDEDEEINEMFYNSEILN